MKKMNSEEEIIILEEKRQQIRQLMEKRNALEMQIKDIDVQIETLLGNHSVGKK